MNIAGIGAQITKHAILRRKLWMTGGLGRLSSDILSLIEMVSMFVSHV